MASRFWVLGTGTWDSSTTTNWAASSNGAGGQSVPGSADTVTFDGSSGGGTVTVNFGGTITIQSLTWGAFTGTLDFSVNNNPLTINANGGFNGSGSGTRTYKGGTGTLTLTASTAGSLGIWTMSTTTGLTWTAPSSIVFTGPPSGGVYTFAGGGLTYSSVNFGTTGGSWNTSGNNSYSTLILNGQGGFEPSNGSTVTATAVTATSSRSSPLLLACSTNGGSFTFSVSAGTVTFSGGGFKDVACSGGATFSATDSYDFGHNTGITITAPATTGNPTRARSFTGM